MEIVLGAFRTRSANSLIMVRNGEGFCENLPPEFRKDFQDLEPETREKVGKVKEAVTELFAETGQVRNYTCKFDGKESSASILLEQQLFALY